MTKEAMKDLVRAVRAHAEAHYNQNGWDYLVECWSDEDIAEWVGDAKDETTAILRCADVVGTLDEMRSEVRAAGEW